MRSSAQKIRSECDWHKHRNESRLGGISGPRATGLALLKEEGYLSSLTKFSKFPDRFDS
jgi:hypothetical protein